MNPYESLNLSKVINAAGKMTYLGSSAVSEQVALMMAEAAKSFVDIAALKSRIGDKVAEMTNTEAAFITSCAASGIAVSVAACIAGTNMDWVESLPEIKGIKREVIIQKGHVIHFGANMTQMIRMSGASVKEIGTVNGVKDYHLSNAISDHTAAVLYVISHHAVSNEMLTLKQAVEEVHRHGVPVIVDAAAEVDLKKYAEMGADLVVYSGHKAIGGPTSGVIIGNKELIEACRLQDKGIARAMKIGKENLIGFYYALQEYMKLDEQVLEKSYLDVVEKLQTECSGIAHMQTKITWDATRPIPRLQVIVAQDSPVTAKKVIAKMENHNPSIRTRNHLADEGIIQFDPRELRPEETSVIAQVLRGILSSR